ISQGEEPTTVVWVTPQTGEVTIEGTPVQKEGWRRVVSALDASAGEPSAGNTATTRLVQSENAGSPQLQQALRMLGNSAPKMQLAQFGAGLPDEGAPAPEGAENGPGDDEQAAPEARDAQELLGPVSIGFVEGRDILMLRGRPEEVQRDMELIGER